MDKVQLTNRTSCQEKQQNDAWQKHSLHLKLNLESQLISALLITYVLAFGNLLNSCWGVGWGGLKLQQNSRSGQTDGQVHSVNMQLAIIACPSAMCGQLIGKYYVLRLPLCIRKSNPLWSDFQMLYSRPAWTHTPTHATQQDDLFGQTRCVSEQIGQALTISLSNCAGTKDLWN